jgi:hypothetical protein
MFVTPVTDATRFLIRMDEGELCPKEEGLGLCSRLVEWVSSPDHPDYHESAMLTFYFARALYDHRKINYQELCGVSRNAAEALTKALGTKIDRLLAKYLQERGFEVLDHDKSCVEITAPVKEVDELFAKFRKKVNPSKEEATHVFESMIRWLSFCDAKAEDEFYDRFTSTIFSFVYECAERAVFDPLELKVMKYRSFQVVLRHQDHQIQDQDLVDFLSINIGFQMQSVEERSLAVTTSPVHDAVKLFIQLRRQWDYVKKEGLQLCTKLIHWISIPVRPDYQEAAALAYLLARALHKKEMISTKRYESVVTKANEAIAKAFPEQSNLEMLCPVDEISLKEESFQLFERLILWLYNYVGDKTSDEYTAAVNRAFSYPGEFLRREWITSEEEDIMLHRAFIIIVKGHKQIIDDQVLAKRLQPHKFRIWAKK